MTSSYQKNVNKHKTCNVIDTGELFNGGSFLSLIDFSKRILVVGDIILDRYVYGTCTKISPECPLPVFDENGDNHKLGGTGNVVENLLELGLIVDIVSLVGTADETVQQLLKRHEHLDTIGLVQTDDFSTRVITRYVAGHVQCFRADRTRPYELTENLQKSLIDKIAHLMATRKYHAVVMSDYGHGVLFGSLTEFVITNGHRLNIPIIADPGKRGNYERFYNATYLKLNHKEITSFSGTNDDLSVTCKAFCERLQIQTCFVTLAENGIALYTTECDPEFETVPIIKRNKVVDVCGAGDTVLAALVFGIAHHKSLLETCTFANICAQNVVQIFGTTTLTLFDVIPQKTITAKQEFEILKRIIPSKYKVVYSQINSSDIDFNFLENIPTLKGQADILIVEMCSDLSISAFNSKQPEIPLKKLGQILLTTKGVDFVYVYDNDDV